MDRPARESLLDRPDAREGRQQRWVDVDDAPAEAVDCSLWPNSPHEAGQDDEINAAILEPVAECASRAARSS